MSRCNLKTLIKVVVTSCIAAAFIQQPVFCNETPSLEQMRSMLPELNRMIETNQKNGEALCTRAIIYQQLGDPQSAIEDSTKAISANPSLFQAYACRLICYMQLKDFAHALKDADETIRLKPGATSFANRAAVYGALNKFPLAIADFTKALHYEPSMASAYDGLGEVAYKLRKYDNAIAYCNRALYLDPKIMEAVYYRGKSYEALGKKDLAKKDLDRAKAAGYKPGDFEVRMEK